jgi:hypothetical protein
VIPAADFIAGGYTGVVNAGFSNPVGGKPGWCAGVLGPMIAVTVNLGADPNLVNRSVRVRWHEGDDTIVGSSGWYVDAVTVTAAQTAAACVPALPAAGEAAQLRADRIGETVTLSWDASCVAGDGDYAVYQGTLGAFTSHAPRLCSTAGARTATLDLQPTAFTGSWSAERCRGGLLRRGRERGGAAALGRGLSTGGGRALPLDPSRAR